jgi:hypothetical protein
MTRFPLLLLAGGLATSLGGILYQANVIFAHQREQLALERHITVLESQRADFRSRQEAAARDLHLAEQQLAALPAAATATAQSSHDPEVQAWLARLKQLRQDFSQHPEQQIPEMRLLNDEEWLQAALHATFDTDDHRRASLAEVRKVAKRNFAAKLSSALSKFIRESGGQLPANSLDLAPLFDPPADPTMLQRYAMIQSGPVTPSNRTNVVLREVAPVDAEFDFRENINAAGGYTTSGSITAWIDDYPARALRARHAYAAAHNGTLPTNLAQTIPYIVPPLPPKTAERLLRDERDRAH